MTYQFQSVTFPPRPTGPITIAADTPGLGIPATITNVLFSGWFTEPTGADNWLFGVNQGFQIELDSTFIVVTLRDAGGGTIIVATLSPVPSWGSSFSNLLVSVQPATHTMQVYFNDAAVPFISEHWFGTGPIGNRTPTPWSLRGIGCAGDVWFADQSVFTDLSIVGNRRKFIDGSGDPVDLGSDGSTPFGSAPPMYCHIAASGSAADFTANSGTGGTFSPTLTYGTCGLFPASAPPSDDTIAVADLWFAPTTAFTDLRAESNRRLFIGVDGASTFLGDDGSRPTGAAPPIYLTLAAGAQPDLWAANAGTGGVFTRAGNDLTAWGGSIPPCGAYTIDGNVPPNTPQGADPEIRLSVSDDGGRTYSLLQKWRSMGKIGEYTKRLRWLKMGMFRERSIRLEVTDPVRRNIVGLYLDVTVGLE